MMRNQFKTIIFTGIIVFLIACKPNLAEPKIIVKTTFASQAVSTASISSITVLETTTPFEQKGVPIQTATSNMVVPTQEILTPRLINVQYSASATKIIVQILVAPGWRIDPSVVGFIYDATLIDDSGYKYTNNSLGFTESGLVEIEYEPVLPQSKSLSLQAILELLNVPTNQPLNLNFTGKQFGIVWDISQTLHFRDIPVQFRTARLEQHISGAPNDQRKQLQVVLTAGKTAGYGMQLYCLNPQSPPSPGGEWGCSQETDVLEAFTSIGPEVNLNSPLPIPTTPILLQVRGDFMLDKTWEISWLVGSFP